MTSKYKFPKLLMIKSEMTFHIIKEWSQELNQYNLVFYKFDFFGLKKIDPGIQNSKFEIL